MDCVGYERVKIIDMLWTVSPKFGNEAGIDWDIPILRTYFTAKISKRNEGKILEESWNKYNTRSKISLSPDAALFIIQITDALKLLKTKSKWIEYQLIQ